MTLAPVYDAFTGKRIELGDELRSIERGDVLRVVELGSDLCGEPTVRLDPVRSSAKPFKAALDRVGGRWYIHMYALA